MKQPIKKAFNKPSFKEWYATVPTLKNDTSSYDLEKAYGDLPYSQMKRFSESEAHLPDTYKKQNHPTFSNESIYHNDKTPGGYWDRDTKGRDRFTPSQHNIDNMGGVKKYMDWFNENEPGVILNLPYEQGQPTSFINNYFDDIIRAGKGLSLGFRTGDKWSVVEDLKGPSHADGGIELFFNTDGISFSRYGKTIKASNGLIIGGGDPPKKNIPPTENDYKTLLERSENVYNYYLDKGYKISNNEYYNDYYDSWDNEADINIYKKRNEELKNDFSEDNLFEKEYLMKKIKNYNYNKAKDITYDVPDNWTEELIENRDYRIDVNPYFKNVNNKKIELDNSNGIYKYYNDIDDNYFEQRELQRGALDVDSPMQLYHKQIKPTLKYTFVDPFNDTKNQDHATVYMYDPILLKSYDNLTNEDKIIRINQYGLEGTPYNNYKELQTILKEQGLYNGAIDGDWGPLSKDAWTKYQSMQQTEPVEETKQEVKVEQPVQQQSTYQPKTNKYSVIKKEGYGFYDAVDKKEVRNYHSPGQGEMKMPYYEIRFDDGTTETVSYENFIKYYKK